MLHQLAMPTQLSGEFIQTWAESLLRRSENAQDFCSFPVIAATGFRSNRFSGSGLSACVCPQGDGKQAEQYLRRALEEAQSGFGKEDAHVASAENNLAELYRVMRQFDKAEQLYMEVDKLLKPEEVHMFANERLPLSCVSQMHELAQM